MSADLYQIWVYLAASPLLALTATLVAYQAGLWLHQRAGESALVNPVLIAVLALLAVPGAGLPASLLFGLVGMAPAGVIIALAGAAMAPERRAFGIGIFYTVYYAIVTAAPPVAGAVFDATGDPHGPLVLGMVLFAAVVPAALLFRHVETRSAFRPAPARQHP